MRWVIAGTARYSLWMTVSTTPPTAPTARFSVSDSDARLFTPSSADAAANGIGLDMEYNDWEGVIILFDR